jgi:hypothetical protein
MKLKEKTMRKNCECTYCKNNVNAYFCSFCGHNFNPCESFWLFGDNLLCPKCHPEDGKEAKMYAVSRNKKEKNESSL